MSADSDPTAQKKSRFSKQQLRRVLLVVGLGLFLYLLYKLNPATLWQYLQKLGPRFLWILLLSASWYVVYSLAWEVFLKHLSRQVHLWEIFKMKVCGEAVNSITPLSWGGGDPVRIYLLKKHIPMNEGTASVVVDRTLNNLAVALFMVLGVLLTFALFDLPLGLRIGLPIALFLILLGSTFLYLRSHQGLFRFFISLLQKLRIKRHFSEKTLKNVGEIDGHISHFYRSNKKGFLLAYALHFLGRIGGVVEIFLIAYFLGERLSFLESYLLASITVLINMIFVLVPGALGIMEGAYAGVFSLLSLNPAVGASVQIVRRLRMIFWVSLGALWLGRGKVKPSP